VAALRTLALAVALSVATTAAADPVDHWRTEIAEASARFGVPVAWIERVMRAESGGQTTLRGRPITSHAGAMGLMQLMPGTWAAMRAAHGLGRNPHDPHDNILAGTAYLRAMYDRFGYPGLFGAYNAGPGRYAAHLATGRALPAETRAYLAKVSDTVAGRPQPLPQPPPPALFVALRTVGASAAPSPSPVPAQSPDTLFAISPPP
jgi:soluble lytic murein transglycosylase-like protein